MSDVRFIKKGSVPYALFLKKGLSVEGVRFLTNPSDDFQVALMERPLGKDVPAHQHPDFERTIVTTSEFLYIERGKILATVFDEDWKELAKEELSAGDFLVFFRGGHSVTILEPVRMIEVKQGPFPGDKKGKAFRPSV